TFNGGGPPNGAKRHPEYFAQGYWWGFKANISSNHPAGANVGFTDGLVKFIKETIDSWAFSGFWQGGVSLKFPFVCDLDTAKPGVIQRIATRDGGEAISADSL